MMSVDPEITLMITAPAGTKISRDNSKVVLKEDFNRRKLPKDLESDIDVVWQNRVSANPSLWNGSKFRLHSAFLENGIFTFNLGVTCYKDFIGTNWSPKANYFKELGQENFENSQAYLSDALGVGSLVLTSNNQVIFLKRSLQCGEAAGLYDIPGGHAEPEELVGKIESKEIDLLDLSPEAVVNEIYDSTLREIRDEVNIPMSCLSDPVMLGIARNTTSAGRPSVEFLVRCNLSSSEIKSRYTKGDHIEADESTAIKFIDVKDLHKLHTTDIWKELAPSAKGCVTLYFVHYSNGYVH